MIKVVETIDNILECFTSNDTLSALEVTVTDNIEKTASTEVIALFDGFVDRLSMWYGERKCLLRVHEDTDENIVDAFQKLWASVFANTTNMFQWGIYYETLTTIYNPTENYDRYADITTEKQGNEKHTYNNAQRTDTSTESVVPNSAVASSFVDKDKVTNVTGANINTDTLDYTDRKDVVTDHTHGNIGIQAVSDMREKEYNSIRCDMIDYMLHWFAVRYTF